MYILGLNVYHGDSSACILSDGKLLAAVEEERFKRIKHWAGLPTEAIKYCLHEAQVKLEDVDHIVVNRNPKAHLLRKILFMLRKKPSFDLIKNRLQNASKVINIKKKLSEDFGGSSVTIKAKFHFVEHHLAHLGSAFFVSPFDEAVVVSVDGFGDFVGTMWGIGRDNKIKVKDKVLFPHSLGLFYLSQTQYLGFHNYGDEYKVMGLASYGEPVYLDKMRQIISSETNGKFRLNLNYFIHHCRGVTMSWQGCKPRMGCVYSKEMENLLGPARDVDEPVTQKHKDIAASMHAMYEDTLFNLLNYVYDQTKISTLCLAGGCAMNSVANGKIFERTKFKQLYVQPAAGDAGGAIGGAYYVWNQKLNKPREFVMDGSYWGPEFTNDIIKEAINDKEADLKKLNCTLENISSKDDLCKKTAKEIAQGQVVGWFQGRMEWGPRALGNRSIVADPRNAEMRDILNLRIKRRESFRPFAPSILLEKVGEYFKQTYPAPFMTKVYPVVPNKHSVIPAVTHVDGTGRLQTVRKEDNPLYWQLIKEFEALTGVPILLNTSFNENEPIVCTPQEALQCFLRTKMDILVLGNYFIKRVQ